jgi:hypothetical protein
MLGLARCKAGDVMAKRLTIEDHLVLLRKLRAAEGTAADVAALEQILRTSRVHGMVVKGAAELAEKWAAKSLVPALAAVAEALAGAEGQKRDPGCEGKEAILRTLVGWEANVPELYELASHWHQQAPVMAGSVDVAAECRGLAAVGLALTQAGGAEAALARIIELLVDEEAATRVRAAQALGLWRGPEALPLLRLKALVGDETAEVMGEVFMGLLRQAGREAGGMVAFVSRFLQKADSRVLEAAAVALGESRQAAALEALLAAWDRLGRDPVRTSVTMAIALLRTEESLAWLLGHIKEGREAVAVEVLEALRIYRGNEKVVARIREAAGARQEGKRVFEEIFTPS